MKTLKIEAGKFYRTRDGRKVRIYRTDVNHSEYRIHGYIISSDGVERSCHWYGDGRYLFAGESGADLISEWEASLEFDWDCLPKWRNGYIAMDADGVWYAYSNEPTQEGAWCCYHNDEAEIVIPKEYQPKNYTGDWTDSVFKNPNLD